MFVKGISAATLAFAASFVSAQTYTECNPLKKSCPADPALGGTVSIDFTKGASSFFTGTSLSYDGTKGAVMTVANENDSPTLTSTKYIFFGRVEVEVEASTGQGIVTSLVLQSDDLDEIDWEWLGTGGDQVQTNYFSKGDTTTYDRGKTVGVGNPTGTFHTYTIDWTPSTLQWIIDGTVVRTLNFADAKGTSAYPQTPMQVKLGTWCAGSKKNAQGTIDWAGGLTDFSQGPFVGYYRKLTITDYGNGVSGASSYSYGDQSGTYQSIKINGGGAASGSGVVINNGQAVSSTSTSASSTSTSKSATTSSSASSTSSSDSSSATTMTTATSNSSATTKSGASNTAATTPAQVTQGSAAAGKLGSSLGLAVVALFALIAV